MTFEENKYKKDCYLKLKKLYIEKKYKEIIKEGVKYLEKYPDDINIRYMYAKALRREERFDECIENLKTNLYYNPEDQHTIIFLYYTYYFLGMYKEAYELFPKTLELTHGPKQSLSITKLVTRKALGMPCYLFASEKDSYVKNQILNYNSDLALLHIKKHGTNKENQVINKDTSSIFNDIDIEYLMEVVKENIKGVKKANLEEVLDIYFFGISNIGRDKDNIINYIKVVVVPNTNNVISIYPTIDIEEKYTYPLNCDHDKLFKRERKVKTMSRIDKFNKKYNM